MIRVSVCLTHYDRPGKLAATLESLARQTRLPDEVFVWDDCSPQDPADIVARFVGSFPYFVYHRNPRNLGMPGNLNAVLAQATGDYVANLHDADTFHPTLLERLSAALDEHASAGFVFCRVGGRNAGQEKRLRGCAALTFGREFNRTYWFNSWRGSSPVWGTAMVRRALYEENLPFDPQYGPVADVDMWMRLSLQADVAFVNAELITLDGESHFVRAVNWPLVHALRRLHGANIRRISGIIGPMAWLAWIRHAFTFGFYYLLCFQSHLRHADNRKAGAWQTGTS